MLGKNASAVQSILMTLVKFCRTINIDTTPFMSALRLGGTKPSTDGARFSLEPTLRIFEMVAIGASDDCLGLRCAGSFIKGTLGAYCHIVLNAPTLGSALADVGQFERLVADYDFFAVQDRGHEVAIVWQQWPDRRIAEQFTDFRARLHCDVIRHYLGAQWMPEAVFLQRAAPASVGLHVEVFGSRIRFGASSNEIVISRKDLEAGNPDADAAFYALIRHGVVKATPALVSSDCTQAVLTHAFNKLPAKNASLVSISESIGISPRSLQRRLAESGTSFEQVLDQARRILSDNLLFQTSLSITEVSARCGYSSIAAYSRVARQWYGTSPSEARRIGGSTSRLHLAPVPGSLDDI